MGAAAHSSGERRRRIVLGSRHVEVTDNLDWHVFGRERDHERRQLEVYTQGSKEIGQWEKWPPVISNGTTEFLG